MKFSKTKLGVLMITLAMIAVAGNRTAMATNKTPKPADPVMEQEQGQAQQQQQGQAQQQHQKNQQAQGQNQQSHSSSDSISESSASSESSSSNEGVENNSTTNSNFLALGLTFPGIASECGRGVQGGGQDDGKAAFLGFNWLDKNCRAQALAAGAVDPMQHARLSCADKVFRNAIAYDQRNSRKIRQQVCIDRTYESNKSFVDAANAEIAETAKLRDRVETLEKQKSLALTEKQILEDQLERCSYDVNKLDDACTK